MNDVPVALPEMPTAPFENCVCGDLTNKCQKGDELEMHWRAVRGPVKIEIGDCFECRVHVLVVSFEEEVLRKGEISDNRSETAAYVISTMQDALRKNADDDYRYALAFKLLTESVSDVAGFFTEDARIASEISESS